MMPDTLGGLLLVLCDPAPGQEAELERWYEDDHLYERSAIEGFICSRRYISVEGTPRSVTLYELTAPEALHAATYTDARVREDREAAERAEAAGTTVPQRMANPVRNEYRLVQSAGTHLGEIGAFIWMVREDVAPEHASAVDDWYAREHLPAVTAIAGVRGVTRYLATVGTPSHLVVYDLATAEVARGDAWREAFAAPAEGTVAAQRTLVATNLGQFFKAVYQAEAREEMAARAQRA